jgi:hypothetical protein
VQLLDHRVLLSLALAFWSVQRSRASTRLEVVPVPAPMRLVDGGDGVTAVADAEMPVLTAAMVRETLERVRR